MPLFTHLIAVDWSAANHPQTGANSIWVAENNDVPVNLPTRFSCSDWLRARMTHAITNNERLLISCDFAFAYPAGLAHAITGEGTWQSLWQYLSAQVTDTDKNVSNRFEVGGKMNAQIGLTTGPFWGHPHQHSGRYENLDMYAPKDLPLSFPKKRMAETRVPSAQSVFKLAGIGSVGSQSILGIAALERLRANPELAPHIAVWPFETNFAGDFSKPITLAEIYPSSHSADESLHSVKDAAQVMSVARDLSHWNRTGALEDKLSAFGLSDTQRKLVINEEGWILGV
jgi:precorrin-8X/cobalt-precorrin-8 methylmutase